MWYIDTINMRFYLLEVRYPHEYYRITHKNLFYLFGLFDFTKKSLVMKMIEE